MEWRLGIVAAEVPSDEYWDPVPVADVGVMPKHYEVRAEVDEEREEEVAVAVAAAFRRGGSWPTSSPPDDGTTALDAARRWCNL